MLEFINLFKSLRPSFENAYDMQMLANKITVVAPHGKETGV